MRSTFTLADLLRQAADAGWLIPTRRPGVSDVAEISHIDLPRSALVDDRA